MMLATLLLDPVTVLGARFDDDPIPLIAIGGGLVIALISVVGSYTRSILVARAREQSRREIAAYVAEGSMSAEDGKMLLDAGRSPTRPGCGRGVF